MVHTPLPSTPLLMILEIFVLREPEHSSPRTRAHLSWRTGEHCSGEPENISMFSTCSKLTPRAPIPDGRMERFIHCILYSRWGQLHPELHHWGLHLFQCKCKFIFPASALSTFNSTCTYWWVLSISTGTWDLLKMNWQMYLARSSFCWLIHLSRALPSRARLLYRDQCCDMHTQIFSLRKMLK